MSLEAYARSQARENKVWNPFVYSFSFDDRQTEDRVILYGLYSGSYLNYHTYLTDVESSDLANLLTDYNTKIADLTNQEAMIVADIVSKRYLAGIDKLIHDQKLVTKAAEIQADDELWDAKTAALEADQAALLTMAAKVAAETEKAQARITELTAYIQTEAYALSAVDLDIAEKQIQSLRVDIEILNTDNEILKIQIDTVNAANKIIDVDLQIANTKIDIANKSAAIAKIDLLESELEIEKARTTIVEGEESIALDRVGLAEAKSAGMDDELEYYTSTLIEEALTDHQNKLDLMNLKQNIRLADIDQRQELKEWDLDEKVDNSNLSLAFATKDSTEQVALDATKLSAINAKTDNAISRILNAVQVARTLAEAKVTTTLTHTIGKQAE